MTQPAPIPAPPEEEAPAAPTVRLAGKNGKLYDFASDAAANALKSGVFRQLTPDEQLKQRVESEERAKGVTGSVATWVSYTLLDIPTIVDEAQALLYG